MAHILKSVVSKGLREAGNAMRKEAGVLEVCYANNNNIILFLYSVLIELNSLILKFILLDISTFLIIDDRDLSHRFTNVFLPIHSYR
jgi:hypothetical protein